METVGREIRHAARRLVRAPAFTVAVVLTLGLAIGANAAIFAVVQRVVMNPLPYPASDRLIALDHGARGLNMESGIPMSPGLYYHYGGRSHALEGIALHRTEDLTLTGAGEPERLRASRVTPSLATVLRVAPAHGRWFSAAEGEPGAPQVAVLAHGLWMRRYGGDPAVVGRSVRLNGVPAEIVGVMPAGYAFPEPRVDLWLPEPLTPAMGFGFFRYGGVARVRDGVTLEAARAELNHLITELPSAYPGYLTGIGHNLHLTSAAIALKEATVGAISRALWILLVSVALVLLVACGNVANLFLVRSETRQREVAVRRALGAGGIGMLRYFVAESALLSMAGGALGAALAWIAVRLLVAARPAYLPRVEEVRVDEVALVFTFALTLAIALAFSAIPAWRSGPVAATLNEIGRGNMGSRRSHRVRHLLMAGQVAMALVLLVGSGLMVRSFQKLRATDPGFSAASALTFRVGLQGSEYATRAGIVAAHGALLEALAALPGVAAVSASTCLPLAEEGVCYGNAVFVEGRPRSRGSLPPSVAFRAVAGGYVETMGMRLLRGRTIERGDVERGEPVVLVNEALAKVYFPNDDPIGRRVASSSRSPAWLTIVGLVGNTPVTARAETNPPPTLYMPMSIAGGPDIPAASFTGPDVALMSYVLRTATPPLGLVPSVRRAVRGVDSNLGIIQVRTLEDILDGASAQLAFTMTLLSVAAGIALVLGVIGIYGVVSYVVSQRTGEIGVRLAVGASPGSVVGMILLRGALAALAGIGIGLVVAFAGGRAIGTLLYGISPRDPGVFAAATLSLLAIALLACWLPARRAARLSPLDALRAE